MVDLLMIIELATNNMSCSMIAKILRELALEDLNEQRAVRATE
jgi:hypothetical protein